MPPIVYTPAPATTFPRTGGTIYWYNAHGTHLAKPATQWRLLVGSTQYGSNYHAGLALSATTLQDTTVFNGTRPALGATCYAVPEYTLADGTICYGTVTTFSAA
jgi:hypothetical protein